MTRFIHDQFAKDYLEELLNPYGQIETARRVTGEVRYIDVWFSPYSSESLANTQPLGLLSRLATTPSIFEPFRNPATIAEISDCLLKILQVRGEAQRVANRNDTTLEISNLPRLWILTPTASANILSEFGAIPETRLGDWRLLYATGVESCYNHYTPVTPHPRHLMAKNFRQRYDTKTGN